jgi:hypothetical protein
MFTSTAQPAGKARAARDSFTPRRSVGAGRDIHARHQRLLHRGHGIGDDQGSPLRRSLQW